jgi:DNA-binding transcriptional LysR family regulator
MKFRLTDINNFIETSSCSTISQAAQKLEISQPALSESLKRLEEDLGYDVFYRSRSGIQLTPSGKIFLARAQTLRRAYDSLDVSPSPDHVFGGRTITIGCHSTVAQYSLPKALAYLKEKAPDYKVDIKHDLSRHIQGEIQSGRIDVGIVINPVEVPDVVIQKLTFDTVGVWSPKSLPKTDTIVCNPNLFQTQSILKRWKDKPNKVISTESLELICSLVNEGIGWGIIPGRAVSLSGFKLKPHEDLPSYKDEICLVYRPEFGKIPAEKLTLEALKKAIVAPN